MPVCEACGWNITEHDEYVMQEGNPYHADCVGVPAQYVIVFEENDSHVFAGRLADGGLGFAPFIETAIHFDTEEQARSLIKVGYGDSFVEIARIEKV